MKTAVAVLALMSVSAATSQQVPSYDDRPKISVNGEAVVYARPDKIVIRLGIETSDPDIMAAKQKNNEILKKAFAVLKESGIPEKEIQTDYLSVEPRYENGYARQNFIGFFVRNILAVNLADSDKVEGLITKALQAGVNYIFGVDFQTTEFKKFREQARELALKAAKEKAEKMAGVLNLSVGSPIQITENYSGSPFYYSSWSGFGYFRGPAMAQNVIQNVSGEQSGEISDTIALGKISMRANVTVVFELKK
jgi:hypothetical protein